MGIEYYAFALFIAGLICAIAIVFKVLFANVKSQKKLLDEQESKILQLYTSVETLMEEFNDQVKLTTDELKEYERRIASPATAHMDVFDLPPALEKKDQLLEKLPRTLPFEANRIRVAGEVLERAERIIKNDAVTSPAGNPAGGTAQVGKKDNGAVFQKFFDETADAPTQQPAREQSRTQTRSDAILALAAEGKTDIEIASELGITRNEVLLVIGLKK